MPGRAHGNREQSLGSQVETEAEGRHLTQSVPTADTTAVGDGQPRILGPPSMADP
jgi:hypothetical protein